ncbi:putative Heat shock protein Hsp90 family [Helianthus anomalus]
MQTEYLEERRIMDLVKKHSEFNYPIYLWTEKTTKKDLSGGANEVRFCFHFSFCLCSSTSVLISQFYFDFSLFIQTDDMFAL